MHYTIKQLGNLAGVSTRTLRYYDKLNLLKPEFVNASGYRIYGPKQVDLLQQILFFKELKFSLKEIHNILASPDFNRVDALTAQYTKLIEEKKRLEQLIANVEKTLDSEKGVIKMSDQEKFEGLKKEMLNQNEKNYGKEIREKYGEETINQSNKKFANLSKGEYDASIDVQQKMFQQLKEAMQLGDPTSTPAQRAADLHRQWLGYFWTFYSKEAHAGLTQMYVDDPRFTKYYDERLGTGAAKMLRDAVLVYTKME
ncbi:MerR family transcriptional regulator [Sporolactobacillus kofuensis]|uniref:MerR family transcriptional regulator n=1 Tax=Sporolactobacillus kofuensis TaxID=269672 RepID=A0ABW1WGP5_9BACL|nr:MerR family transcriptional regulator [Sporolactobacillus kofuensis]MCO7175329.1 MerR family transcriptional regulator [Sporolactobacillus kofuensis]